MSFDDLENSADAGRPVELYTFSRGSVVWRFTSADRQVTVETLAYTPAIISHGDIEQGPETMRNALSLSVPHNFPIAEIYKIAPPSDSISLVLREYHYGDEEIKTVWQGEILGVSFSAGGQAEIQLQPTTSDMSAFGLRRCYQRSCPFVLYGTDCTLDPAAFRTVGTVSVLNGLQVTVLAADAKSDGYFDGGIIEWEIATGVYERRFISSHVGAVITVEVFPIGLFVATEVRLYPGCDHSIETCNAKFNNLANYGGMPYIPVKNPFGSDPIF